MVETHEKIMSMVHELEEEYGTLSATPLDSDKLKQLQNYTKSLPNERGGGYIPRQYTIDDIQKALDTGEKKRDITKRFGLSSGFIFENVKAGRLDDKAWSISRSAINQIKSYKRNKERLNKEAKDMGL